MYMLRDYQEEICSRVREAFKKHRSVMMQMPTGTGKTVVLAEIVREYLNVNVNVNVKGGCNVLIVAHRRELVEQIQQALLRVMGAEDLPHPSAPARRGSTSPSAPPPQEGAPTGKPAVLYSQTSSRPVGVARGYRRNRVAIVHAPVAPLRMEDCHSGVSADVCMRQRALGA